MEKTITKTSMGWLQSINYACKICGAQYMLKEEAERCYDNHKMNKGA